MLLVIGGRRGVRPAVNTVEAAARSNWKFWPQLLGLIGCPMMGLFKRVVFSADVATYFPMTAVLGCVYL